jgi:hypothetical protein
MDCSLAAYEDISGSPPQILKLHGGDLAGTHAQPGQKEKDSVITASGRRPAVTCLQKLVDLLRLEERMRSRFAPPAHRWNRISKVYLRLPPKEQEPQERSQRGRSELCRRRPQFAHTAEQKIADLLRLEANDGRLCG